MRTEPSTRQPGLKRPVIGQTRLCDLHRIARTGHMVIYAMVAMVALAGFVSLGVDMGRVQLAKLQLQTAADAAALYGAAGLSSGVTTVQTRVAASIADNRVDGQTITFDSTNDLEFGVWDPANRAFNVLSGANRSTATAVRITVRRVASRNNGVPLFFSALLGRSTLDVSATAIATRGHSVSKSVDADSCPWLAGMPNGTLCDAYDGNPQNSISPAQSPAQVSGLTMTAGQKIYFRQASGNTGWADGSGGSFGPDGDTDWIVSQQADNGIPNTKAPIQCLVGIFLDDRQPSSYSTGTGLDFTTGTSRDFTNLSPGLKQVFFIGDGINSTGALQSFTIPTGATRLYLGLMDEKGWWWDNYGTVSTTILDTKAQLVK